jgi:endothelin-converting enzyme/putative endopeptidase
LEFPKDIEFNKPVDKTEWYMSPQTVNAYYNPAYNEIYFRQLFYKLSISTDEAVNYGGIGCYRS